jgi:glycosyltransferase involved in cell wall biosynthesis
MWDIPAGVEIDYTLAEAISPKGSSLGERGRLVRAAANLGRTNPAGKGFTRADVAANRTNPAWWRMMLMARAETNIVRDWASSHTPPDVAYTYWLGSTGLGMSQAWPDVPLVSRVHNSELYPYSTGLRSIPFQRERILSCHTVACVSRHGEQFLSNLYPEAVDRLEVRRLGIPDPGVLAPVGEYPETLKVLSASSMRPNKRVHLIAAAVVELARQGIRTHWVHLGDGSERAAVEACLREATAELTWDLPGVVNVDDVRREMASGEYDVFVNVSTSEGAPVSIMEAQSVGIPTVATDVGGSAEVAVPDFNVILDPDPTASDVTKALLEAASMDPAMRPRRRQHWTDNYNASTNYEAFAAELASLARGGSQ